MSAPFTDVEMMYIAKMAYFDVPSCKMSDGSNDVSLYSLLSDGKSCTSAYYSMLEEFGKKNSNGTYEPTPELQKFFDKIENGNYKIVAAASDPKLKGFEAMAIEGPDEGTVTVTARGSVSAWDWLYTDILGIGLMAENDQQDRMNDFLKDVGKDYDSIYLTGHSLGGNLAVSGAVGYEDQDKIKGVYTYNAPGMNAEYRMTHAAGIEGIEDKVINYQNKNDFISEANKPIGDDVRIVDSNDSEHGAHSLGKMKVTNGEFEIAEGGKNPALKYGVDYLVHLAKRFTSRFLPLLIAVPTIIGIGYLIDNPVETIIDKIVSGYNTASDKISDVYRDVVNIITGNKDVIFINTDGLRDKADNLKVFQIEYSEITQKMSNLIISLKENHIWDTSATTTFINNYLEIKSVFDKFSEIMLEYSAILEGVSDRMQSTDHSLATQFGNLSV